MIAIVLPDTVAQRAIAAGAAVGFDPLMLIRRNGLTRELSADPVGGLGENNFAAGVASAERGSDTARAGADDEDFAMEFWQCV